MNQGKHVFAQVMEFVEHYRFDQCVETYHGHRYAKSFSCREQFLAMAFGQLSYRESLRDVVICLSSQKAKLYHLGFKAPVAKSTIARANEKRDWCIYQDFASILIKEARRLYVDDTDFKLKLDGTCYAIDSTSIELCLSLFPWAPYVETKAAVKLHTVMDLRGSIPTFFHITSGKVNDMKFLDLIYFESGSYYVMDRGYIDFKRLYDIHQAGAFFVTRARSDIRLKRLYSKKIDTRHGLRCDQVIHLSGKHTKKLYPDTLRRVKYYDKDTDKYYVFLTNNFIVSPQTIADLYKHRWQIELFFKWIKQHLKIKTFWGHSENAVKTQICIALCSYLIVAILKKKLGIKRDLYEILQILSVSLLDKTPLVELFSDIEIQISDAIPQKALPLRGF